MNQLSLVSTFTKMDGVAWIHCNRRIIMMFIVRIQSAVNNSHRRGNEIESFFLMNFYLFSFPIALRRLFRLQLIKLKMWNGVFQIKCYQSFRRCCTFHHCSHCNWLIYHCMDGQLRFFSINCFHDKLDWAETSFSLAFITWFRFLFALIAFRA